ncbi:MAG: alanine racemase [Bacteroidota bacterium]
MMSNYHSYKNRLKGFTFPYAVLDLALFRKNIQRNLARAGNKKIRIATKSIRCVSATKMILDSDPQFQGLMTYHGKEVLFLLREGFNDLLMGYPIVNEALIELIGAAIKQGKRVCLMIDSQAHLQLIDKVGKRLKTKIPVCIDLDLSDNYPGLRFGVWRSSIDSLPKLEKLLEHLKKLDYVRLKGLMGYEAQVAGVGDQVEGAALKNFLVYQLKKRSIKRLRQLRRQAIALVESQGFDLDFVNGGGTGSLETTAQEEVVSEVTVGSGFYNAHLFDNYRAFDLDPALFYAIEVVRQSNPGVYTCHGGGFIASGAVEASKAPQVYLPQTGYLDPLEGAGEVQSPIRFKTLSEPLQLGDPVFLRHAKSGELCERFKTLVVLDGENRREWATYRGNNCTFG